MELSPTLEVKLDGEDREIFMSFGLLNELSTLVDSPEQVAIIPLNPTLRSQVLGALFAKRKKSGKIEQAVDIEDLDISIAHAEAAMAWAMEHLTAFFIRALRKVVEVTEKNKNDIRGLESSLDGLKN